MKRSYNATTNMMAAVEDGLREFPVVIVPIGSTEQHGYHLPIGTDVYLAEALAEKTAEKTGALVYPSIHFGILGVGVTESEL